MREWQRAHRTLRLAVNLSPPELMKRTLPDEVKAALEEPGFPKQLLQLEVPEGHVVSDMPRSVDMLHRLKALGVSLVLDRFAVRYSSLGRLAELPLDGVKLDLAFLRGPSSNTEDVSLLTAVTAVARGLKLRVSAQGIENAAQLHLLERLGCAEVQGFHLGPPVPPATLADQLSPRGPEELRRRGDELRRTPRDARSAWAAADALGREAERPAHAHPARASRGAGAARGRVVYVTGGAASETLAGRLLRQRLVEREGPGAGARAPARRHRLSPARRRAGRDGPARRGHAAGGRAAAHAGAGERAAGLAYRLLPLRAGARRAPRRTSRWTWATSCSSRGLQAEELLMRAVTALDHGELPARAPSIRCRQSGPRDGASGRRAHGTGSYAADFTGEAVLSLLRFASQVLSRAVVFAIEGEQARAVGEFGISPKGVAALRDRPSRCASRRSLKVAVERRRSYTGPLEPTRVNLQLADALAGGTVHAAVSVPLVVQGEVRYVLYGDNARSTAPIGPLDALESAAARAARIVEKTLLAPALPSRATAEYSRPS